MKDLTSIKRVANNCMKSAERGRDIIDNSNFELSHGTLINHVRGLSENLATLSALMLDLAAIIEGEVNE